MFFTPLIRLIDTIEETRRRRETMDLVDEMLRCATLNLVMERIRREITTEGGENTAAWYQALHMAENRRSASEKRIAQMLPSRSFRWEKADGFKRK